MAGKKNHLKNLAKIAAEAQRNLETSLTTVNNKWKIEYARFFNFPRFISSSFPNLRSLPKSKLKCGGTWFPSSSIAYLQIVTDFLNPESVLLVSIGDKVFEEHFTCNLHFSWPQVSCVSTQCSPRGSRVIFASYKDCHGQIQKFALRFASSCDAETFIGALKDSLKDAMEMGVTRSDSGSEISSQSEFVPSDRLQFRPEELSFVDPVATYSPQMRSILNYNSNENRCCQESLVGQGQNFERVSQVDLPPSFTALLTNCSTEVEQEKVMAPNELDLESLVMRYASESSFLDMLDKIDEVITEMGGDLAL